MLGNFLPDLAGMAEEGRAPEKGQSGRAKEGKCRVQSPHEGLKKKKERLLEIFFFLQQRPGLAA